MAWICACEQTDLVTIMFCERLDLGRHSGLIIKDFIEENVQPVKSRHTHIQVGLFPFV